jgi:Cys-tRNA(Pro)/Cys-tRNA(Cys) deacylase
LATKTNALRVLDQAGIEHEVREYSLAMEEFTAERVAGLLGMPPDQVFKTLIAVGDKNGPCFAVIPANAELDLKALASAHGERRIRLASLKEVLPLTGYERGAVTAIAARKPFPVYLDEVADLFDRLAVSAGARGLQVILATTDYVSITHATIAPIGV